MLQWFVRFPEFDLFTEFLFHLKENSIVVFLVLNNLAKQNESPITDRTFKFMINSKITVITFFSASFLVKVGHFKMRRNFWQVKDRSTVFMRNNTLKEVQ